MTTISIDGKDYPVARELRADFVIADAGGAFAFADYAADGSGWSWWAGSPTPDDAEALRDCINAAGGFDVSQLTIQRPETD